MKGIIVAFAAVALSSTLAACGDRSGSTASVSPTMEQRRLEAERIRANTEKGVAARAPVVVQRTGDARVDGYRVLMETRRRAMHGVGPKTSDGEASMSGSKGAR